MTEPVWVGPARFVDYEQTAVGGGAAPVSDVRLACVESDVTQRPSRRRRRRPRAVRRGRDAVRRGRRCRAG